MAAPLRLLITRQLFLRAPANSAPFSEWLQPTGSGDRPLPGDGGSPDAGRTGAEGLKTPRAGGIELPKS